MARHRTTAPFCVACRLRASVCVCADAPRLRGTTRVVLIVHQAEWAKSANTGHLVRLALQSAEVRVQGRRHRPVHADGIDPFAPTTLVLYPGRGATPMSPERLTALPGPITLLVPDGNWMQAKNMMRRVPMLRAARPVSLEDPACPLPTLRRNVGPVRRSTFAAIARALGLLEGADIETRLLTFFSLYLNRKTTC